MAWQCLNIPDLISLWVPMRPSDINTHVFLAPRLHAHTVLAEIRSSRNPKVKDLPRVQAATPHRHLLFQPCHHVPSYAPGECLESLVIPGCSASTFPERMCFAGLKLSIRKQPQWHILSYRPQIHQRARVEISGNKLELARHGLGDG